jgi:TPR repeat protein
MYAEGRVVPPDYVRAHMWFSLSAAQGEQRAVKTEEIGRTEDAPRSDKRSAEARTRLEAGYAATSSLKECALRPVLQIATGRVSSAWKRYGTVGHIGG